MDKHKGPPEASPLTNTDLAYLAGIIDGEGSIGIYARAKGSSNYFLKLMIANTSEPLIKWIRTRFGGATVFTRYDNPAHRPTWNITIYQQHVADVLRACRPYMVAKADQADLAIDFAENFRTSRGRWVVPVEEVERRKSYSERMMALNRPHLYRRVVAAATTKRRGTPKRVKR